MNFQRTLMLNLDPNFVRVKANEYGFSRDTLEKVLRLADILYFVNTHPVLSKRLALKGGTAINFTILNLPRLSVDIDLDYRINVSKDEMLIQREEINVILDQYMSSQKYDKDRRSKLTHSLDSWVFTYTGISGNKDNLKIEINYSLRAHILEIEHREILHELIQQESKIAVVASIELFASKIVALLNRAATRDLYDVWKLYKSSIYQFHDHALLRKCVIFYACISSTHSAINLSLDSIDSINVKKVKIELLPVLSKNDDFELEHVQSQVKEFIASLFFLTKEEDAFIIEFIKGHYHPELLFTDPSILERIKNHPMVLWKTGNFVKI